MVKRALNRKMWRDLWILRAQTFTTAILIICGVSLLVSTWSAYRSLEAARDSYYQNYKFGDLFADFKRASIEPIRQIAKIPGVQIVSPRLSATGLVNAKDQLEPAVGHFLSLPPGRQPLLQFLHLRKGRLPIDSTDVEIVVHEGFAQANGLKPGDRLGLIVQGQSEQARIVGIGLSPEFVYALSPNAPLPDDIHYGVFWMTEKNLQRILKMDDGYNSLVAKIDSRASKSQIIASVDRILKPYGSLGSYGRDRQVSNIFVEDEIAQQRISSILNPAIFLGIATFLINIIASRLITLHRSQIAALKALGYTRLEVSTHYLKLILMMSLAGTIPGLAVGAALGSWMSSTYSSFFRFPSLDFIISPTAIAIGIFAGILPGLIGAAASIHSVFNMAPAEAMRPAAPPGFHASIIEKLHLQKILSTTGKMAFRNLLQRPRRLSLVILSISMAIAIVVTAGSWSDMINYLLNTQFQRLQKEDLSISLLRPKPASALQEISQIPGVIASEGFRVLPVRIKFLNHKRELALTGWPEQTRMRELLNRDLKPISLPPSGMLLSRFFEKSWGMKRGDLIQLESLEGTSRTFIVPVAGFTDELIGINANMRIESLWKLMGEDPGYNLVTIKGDSNRLSELYVELKSRPEIASVNLKQSLYKGFRDSFGKIIKTSSLVLTIASLLIALGIIYNTVRVSFSERSWELASLRVLGFEKWAVTQILLFEVGAQVALSLIPGCILGWALTVLSMNLIHTETFSFPVVIETATYARALLTALVAFAASSWLIYRMTGRLNPAEALKAYQ